MFSDFTKLFETLKLFKGSVEMRKEMVRDVITEAQKFKRKGLAQLLENFLAALEKNGNSASVSVNNMTNSMYGHSSSHS